MAVNLINYASKGNLRKVKRCIENGVVVDACESSGNSALYYAVCRDRRKCVKYLLERGADPNRVNKEGCTPVNAACLNKNLECLGLLVRHGGSLGKVSTLQTESAIESARLTRHKKLIKFVSHLTNKDLTDDKRDFLEPTDEDGQKGEDSNHSFPELSAALPQITGDQLKAPQMKLLDDLPHMTLQNALWFSTPVTVKHFKGKESMKQLLMKEADLLSWLRHPRFTLLMAVCLDSDPENSCLVLEHFELASLNHLLYKTNTEINLPQRVHIMLDVAEGMTYLHGHSIVHSFLNSLSILIHEKFRGKIGNLEYSQETKCEEQIQDDVRSIQKNWMAPEQLSGTPPNMSSDVYSFGALMWEILARKVPWSWLQKSSVTQAVCVDHKSLPMLDIWPFYVQSIIKPCLHDAAARPNFRAVHSNLLAIKDSGEDLTSVVLDGAFPYWLEEEYGVIYSEIRPNSGPSQPNKCRSSDIHVLLRRSSSAVHHHQRRRSTSVKAGLRDLLKVMSDRSKNSPREKEIERFGYQIAERLAYVRNIRRHARNHNRTGWAKEIVLTRALEGDIERVKKAEQSGIPSKAKGKQMSRHGRRYSVFDEEGFERIQTISSKYKKKNWSKILHGEEKLKNSMEGFKRLVFEELNAQGYENELLTVSNDVSEQSEVYEDLGNAIKARKAQMESTCSRPESKESTSNRIKRQDLTESQAEMTNAGSEVLELSSSEDPEMSMYAKPYQKNRNSVPKEISMTENGGERKKVAIESHEKGPSQMTRGTLEMSGADLVRARSQSRKVPLKNSTSDLKADITDRADANRNKQQNTEASHSDIHGSSSHGLYAISDFLRETESFRKERSEMIALRSQNTSITSAVVEGSNAERMINSRPRAQSVRHAQPRRKSRSRTVLSDKRVSINDTVTNVPEAYPSSSHDLSGVRVERSNGQPVFRLRSKSEEISDKIKSFHSGSFLGESSNRTDK